MHRPMIAVLILMTLISTGCQTITRGHFVDKACKIDMPAGVAYAKYYDRSDNEVIHNYKGQNIQLVEVIDTVTKNNHLCQAEPGGPGPCVPPKAGFCMKIIGGTNMCLPC